MTPIDSKIIAAKLQKLFHGSAHFCICDFDRLCELAGGVIPAKGDAKRLRALHCVKYDEMDAELRQWLFETVVETLSGEHSFPQIEVGDSGRLVLQANTSPPGQERTLRQRFAAKLLGGGAS